MRFQYNIMQAWLASKSAKLLLAACAVLRHMTDYSLSNARRLIERSERYTERAKAITRGR